MTIKYLKKASKTASTALPAEAFERSASPATASIKSDLFILITPL